MTRFGDHFREEPSAPTNLTVDGSLGNDFSFKHWERSSVSRDLKLSMLLGRHSRFLQPPRSKKARLVVCNLSRGLGEKLILRNTGLKKR